MNGMGNGWQTFMRMANLLGPQQDPSGMPNELPVSRPQPPLINRGSPGISTPGIYGDEGIIPDEEVFAQAEQPQSTLELFRQNVLNPPQRTSMTYPKNTLAGLSEALKIAATPTDYEKNRVFIDGNAYQPAKAFKDPVTGERRFITKYKQPGFMEQVMKAMPAAVSPAVDILNQPYQDAIADWELRNKGYKEAIGAESAMALARQREAQAGYTGQRADIERDKLEVSRMTAEERVRASQLNTLTDYEKIQMLQDGRVSIAELQAAEAMRRVEAQQAGATKRTEMQQTGAGQRTAATIAGAKERNQATIAGANARNAATIAGANQRSAASIGSRGVSGAQQKLQQQMNAAEFINQNPGMEEFISFDAQGFPTISEDMPEDLAAIAYAHIYRPAPKDISLPASTAPQKAPGSSQMPTPKYKAAPGSMSVIPMTTPDGKGVRMVPQDQVETALAQGYQYQTSDKK